MHKFKKKEYQKEGLTVIWDMPKCIHSENCWRGLGEVFRRNERPWIDLEGADNKRIMQQIDRCPSGALSYRTEGMTENNDTENKDTMEINVTKNGPAIIMGSIIIQHSNGTTEVREGNTALCRCGASASKPFCDGSHNKVAFED